MATVESVCTSERKGTAKSEVGRARMVDGFGIEGDSHGGTPKRQVSLLAEESIDKMRAKGLELSPGAFGENMTTRGIDLIALPMGTRLAVGEEAVLVITAKGKICHDHCAIYEAVGDCIMPREGVFTEVVRGGEIAAGDVITVLSRPEGDQA